MLSRNNGKSTWAYEMHYAQSFLQYPDWVEGSHSDDLFSVFGEGHYREIRETLGDYNTADHETKDYVMSYLTNFAWTGLVKNNFSIIILKRLKTKSNVKNRSFVFAIVYKL